MNICKKHYKVMDSNEKGTLESTEGLSIVKAVECDLCKKSKYFKKHGKSKEELLTIGAIRP